MAKTIKQPWGETWETFRGLSRLDNGKKVYSYGENTIKPYGFIPIHLHSNDSEDYIPRSKGVKILVMKESDYNEYKKFSKSVLINRIKNLEPAEVGRIVSCPKGYVHALYNDSAQQSIVEFIKYTSDSS